MRYVSLLCICCSVAGIGAAASVRSRRRVSALGGIAAFFNMLSLSAAMYGGDIQALLDYCEGICPAGLSFPAALRKALTENRDVAEAWAVSAAGCEEARFLTPEECRLLSSFGAAFSDTSLEAFREKCAGCRARFDALRAEAQEKNRRNGKLYITFSSLFAALLFIILV